MESDATIYTGKVYTGYQPYENPISATAWKNFQFINVSTIVWLHHLDFKTSGE